MLQSYNACDQHKFVQQRSYLVEAQHLVLDRLSENKTDLKSIRYQEYILLC